MKNKRNAVKKLSLADRPQRKRKKGGKIVEGKEKHEERGRVKKKKKYTGNKNLIVVAVEKTLHVDDVFVNPE